MLIDFGGIKEQTSHTGTGLYTPGYAPYEHIMGRAIASNLDCFAKSKEAFSRTKLLVISSRKLA
jgi:hypothetical protein